MNSNPSDTLGSILSKISMNSVGKVKDTDLSMDERRN